MSDQDANGKGEGSSRPRRWRVVAGAAALGVLGIWLGIPHFLAGAYLGVHDDTLRDLAEGRNVDPARIDDTVAGRDAAQAWIASGRNLSDRVILRMSEVRRSARFGPERRARLAEAIADQRRALALSPADAYGWTRLAQVLAAAAVPVREIEPYLRMAILRARNESNLLEARLGVELLYWRGLSAETRALIAGEVRRAALWAPEVLVPLARARGLEEDVQGLLAGHPGLLARYNYTRENPSAARREP